MLQTKLNEMKLGLSITSRGVLKFQRIDRIEAPFVYEEEYYHPIVTDDADCAVMWFDRKSPFRDSDGTNHYPEKLRVYSDILKDVELILTKEEVLDIWNLYVFNNILPLHEILRRIDPEFSK